MTPPHIHLRKILRFTPEGPRWPPDVRVVPFEPLKHAPAVHQLLTTAYRDGGGAVPSFVEWWARLRSDEEYDPELVFLAVDSAGRVVGVAQCWTSAFVRDLAVDPAWRRQGLATALLIHAFKTFWSRGADTVDLKVELSNPSGAERLYRELGMAPVEEE